MRNKMRQWESALIFRLSENISGLQVIGTDNPNGGLIGPRGLISEFKTEHKLTVLFKGELDKVRSHVAVDLVIKFEFGNIICALEEEPLQWYGDLSIIIEKIVDRAINKLSFC